MSRRNLFGSLLGAGLGVIAQPPPRRLVREASALAETEAALRRLREAQGRLVAAMRKPLRVEIVGAGADVTEPLYAHARELAKNASSI